MPKSEQLIYPSTLERLIEEISVKIQQIITIDSHTLKVIVLNIIYKWQVKNNIDIYTISTITPSVRMLVITEILVTLQHHLMVFAHTPEKEKELDDVIVQLFHYYKINYADQTEKPTRKTLTMAVDKEIGN